MLAFFPPAFRAKDILGLIQYKLLGLCDPFLDKMDKGEFHCLHGLSNISVDRLIMTTVIQIEYALLIIILIIILSQSETEYP